MALFDSPNKGCAFPRVLDIEWVVLILQLKWLECLHQLLSDGYMPGGSRNMKCCCSISCHDLRVCFATQ
jgi:hypothetical protein